MKKIFMVLLVAGVGLFSFLSLGNQSSEKNGHSRFIAFGKVDLSDESDYDDYSDDESNDDSDWFENFIANHKTPFSKTTEK